MRWTAVVIVAVAALAAPLWAQNAPKNPSRPVGPARPPAAPSTTPRLPARIEGQVYVGDRAPDFEVDGSQGRPVKLSSLHGSWVLLVFANDRALFGRLGPLDAQLREIDVRTLGVCGEKARTLESLSARDSLKVVWLADVTGEISALYGLFDFERSMIRPGFVLIDAGGVVRMALLGQALPPEEIARLVRFGVAGY
jgi:peroxiredoxin